MNAQVDSNSATPETLHRYPIANDNLDLLAFLDRARKRDSLALPVLADWLDDRDDPRAGGVRDLLIGTITIPKGISRRQYVTVAEGPGWMLARSQVMVRMSLVAGSRLCGLFGREMLYAEQLCPSDRRLLNLHGVIERSRRKAVFALFGTSSHDIEMRSVIAHSLLDSEGRDLLFRKYRVTASPTIYGVCSTVRRLELEAFGEEVVRADGEQMIDRFTPLLENFSDLE